MLLVGCDDFATPAEVSRPQILGIQSEPASLEQGESARLSILVAAPSGPVEDPQVVWSLVPQSDLSDQGSLVDDGSSVRYQAPSTLPSLPAIVTVAVRVEHEGTVLEGLKAMLIGGPPLVNPAISAITVDGQIADDTIVLQQGAESSLAVETEAPLGSNATYAWYARPGSIEEYRSTPTTIVAPDEIEEDGWLYVVVRDNGGIGFVATPMRVE